MDTLVPVFWSVVASLVSFIGLAYAFSKGWIPVIQRQGVELTQLSQLQSQQTEVKRLSKEVERLTTLYTAEQLERVELLKDLTKAYRKISDLEDQYRATQTALHLLQAQFGIGEEKKMRVLGVWPQMDTAPLNQDAEKRAIYNAGISYIGLERDKANKINILRELRIAKIPFNILEVGAHGDQEGILLADGIAEPGWWARILKDRAIRVVILLACHSDSQVADAVINIGVPFVIAVDGEVLDNVAVNFIRAFYINYADGMDTREAYDYALLVLNRKDAEGFRLRER